MGVVLRFGRFELDLEREELRKHGVRVRIPPQPLRVLVLLALRPQELVTRDEIRRTLWSDDTFVDFEQGINAAIRIIRHVLNDHATAPQFVQTIPRRGYRFLAVVEHVNEPAVVVFPRRQPSLMERFVAWWRR
jgi:DNA-binding winged-HTH domains